MRFSNFCLLILEALYIIYIIYKSLYTNKVINYKKQLFQKLKLNISTDTKPATIPFIILLWFVTAASLLLQDKAVLIVFFLILIYTMVKLRLNYEKFCIVFEKRNPTVFKCFLYNLPFIIIIILLFIFGSFGGALWNALAY